MFIKDNQKLSYTRSKQKCFRSVGIFHVNYKLRSSNWIKIFSDNCLKNSPSEMRMRHNWHLAKISTNRLDTFYLKLQIDQFLITSDCCKLWPKYWKTSTCTLVGIFYEIVGQLLRSGKRNRYWSYLSPKKIASQSLLYSILTQSAG